MPWPRLAAAGWLVTLLAPTAVSAQAPGPGSPPAGAIGSGREPMKAFGRLFDARAAEARAAVPIRLRRDLPHLDALPPVRPNSARRFRCPMIVLPADSSLDPTFEKPILDRTTRFTMEIVQPSCH
jgi:hypothetical protein